MKKYAQYAKKYAKNDANNMKKMQSSMLNMQKYDNMQKICTICKKKNAKKMQKNAKISTICKNTSIMQKNMQKYAAGQTNMQHFQYAKYAKYAKICKICSLCNANYGTNMQNTGTRAPGTRDFADFASGSA